jgi:hypothetical protein
MGKRIRVINNEKAEIWDLKRIFDYLMENPLKCIVLLDEVDINTVDELTEVRVRTLDLVDKGIK